MKGSIRFILGLLIAFGAVGTLDVNPDASLRMQATVAIAGLLLMYSGLLANQRQRNG